MGSGSKKVTVGYKYYVGMHMVICHGPVDDIIRIDVSDKTAWTGSATEQIQITASNLFGGKSREGGISGLVDIAMGKVNQIKNSYLVSKLGPDIPAFKGVVSAILRQVYIGQNPYLKPWSFWPRRRLIKLDETPQWYIAKAAIGEYDMNPIHIIRECLTDREIGLGYGEIYIGDSFTTAADKLYAENFGLSILWSKQSSIDEFIGEVLSHIDANLYVSRITGKFEISLIRDDYDINTLPEFNELNVQKVSNYKRTEPSELVNTVTVQYLDVNDGKEKSVTVKDDALIGQHGRVNSSTNKYYGISNSDLAIRVASRDLKAASVPLCQCTIYADRSAAKLNIGDPIKFSWSDLRIDQVVMRVTNVELGELTDNTVVVTLIEDVFGLSDAVYIQPVTSGWVKPQNEPLPAPYHVVDNATYYELAQNLGDADASQIDPSSSYLAITAVRPSADAFNAEVNSKIGGVWYDKGFVDFCPTAVLVNDISVLQSVIQIDSQIDVDLVEIGSYAYIDNEIVRIDSIDSNSITIGRGCIDTVPVPHLASTRIFFVGDFFGSDEVEYVAGETASVRLLPVTSLGVLPDGDAVTQTKTIVARHYKPYPPGNFKLNNVAYPTTLLGPTTVSWSHRDRLNQTGPELIDTTYGHVGPEVGVTYTLNIEYNPNSWVLAKNSSGISGSTYSWSTEATDIPDGVSSIQRFTLSAVRSGISSFQSHQHIVERVGLGYNLGNYLGGV